MCLSSVFFQWPYIIVTAAALVVVILLATKVIDFIIFLAVIGALLIAAYFAYRYLSHSSTSEQPIYASYSQIPDDTEALLGSSTPGADSRFSENSNSSKYSSL